MIVLCVYIFIVTLVTLIVVFDITVDDDNNGDSTH